jgi:hypothetical protein
MLLQNCHEYLQVSLTEILSHYGSALQFPTRSVVDYSVERSPYYISTYRDPTRHLNIAGGILFLIVLRRLLTHIELRSFITCNSYLALLLKENFKDL